jgi:hypothetical protein
MSSDPTDEQPAWAERVQQTLERYDEALLRLVAGKLLRPRNHWPVDDLIQRSVETLTNAPVIDRRLKELPPAARKLLTIFGRSNRHTWGTFDLVWMLAALGHAEGLTPVQTLLESGLLYPVLPDTLPSLRSFDLFFAGGGTQPVPVFIHPAVAARARGEPLELPLLTRSETDARSPRLGDGFEYPLRIAVLWQQIAGGSIRLTQSNLLFKRDLLRLQGDDLLKTPFAEHFVELPDGGVLMLALAVEAGVIASHEGELTKGTFSPAWKGNTSEVIREITVKLWGVHNWDPVKGYFPVEGGGPMPSVGLLLLLLLQDQPAKNWVSMRELAKPFWKGHPTWASHLGNRVESGESWVQGFLLGVAYQLRLVEVQPEADAWLVRLSELGRAILTGGPLPPSGFDFPQTLIVQPNGEVILYRQGLTPPLLSKLTRFANWKTLGAACTMELNAESVYRGLEAGVTLQDILKLLQQHGTRSLPPTVMDSLQRWSNKRERITLFAAATLLEFTSPEDLEVAFQRGLVAQKLTDRIGLIESSEPDYRSFRLVGNRDYEARSQPCIRFDSDGVTFTIDAALSDLVLEAELVRLAEPVESEPGAARRSRLTRDSLIKAREQGISRSELEQWCLDRSGEPLSPAAGLLYGGDPNAPARLAPRVVLQLPTQELADGIVQLPLTFGLIDDRLGSHALAIKPEQVDELLRLLADFGVAVERG